MKVLVSACLLNMRTRYDGKKKGNKSLLEFLLKNNIDFFPLCAEQIGGLPTPRDPSEIEVGFNAEDVINGKGRVLTKSGIDVTNNFLTGAKEIVKFCKSIGITYAILAEKSPSCGYTKVYDGTFGGILKEGKGILAQLLDDNGIIIVDDYRKLTEN